MLNADVYIVVKEIANTHTQCEVFLKSYTYYESIVKARRYGIVNFRSWILLNEIGLTNLALIRASISGVTVPNTK